MTENLDNPQAPRRARTRQALLAAGAELLSAHSIDALSVNDIVDAAGVAKGSFFNHFEDKDAFASEIAGAIRRMIENRVQLSNAEISDPRQRVARGICVFVQFAMTQPKQTRIMLRGQERATAKDHPLNKGLRKDIAAGIALGKFSAGVEDAGFILLVGLCSALMLSVVNEPMRADRITVLATDTISLGLTGLGVPARTARNIVTGAVRALVTG